VGRVFSVEMGSKRHVKSVLISDDAHDRVLFEGNLGELEGLSMIEESMLEVRGAHGVLRMDIGADELTEMLAHPCADGTLQGRKGEKKE
jgi:hypothetical protein